MTSSPVYSKHTEYRWSCELVGDVPFLAALLLDDESGLFWSRSGRKCAVPSLNIELSFRPYYWVKGAHEVGVALSQHYENELTHVQTTVDDKALGRDPRGLVDLDLSDGAGVTTGGLARVATVNAPRRLSAGLALVALIDTESCRASRWRVKRRLGVNLPPILSFLRAGQRAGFSPRADSLHPARPQ